MKKALLSLACLVIVVVAGDTKVVDSGKAKIFTIELHEDLHVMKNEDSLFAFINDDCLYIFRATIVEERRIALKEGARQCKNDQDKVKVPTTKKVLIAGEDGMLNILGTKLGDESVIVKKGRKLSVVDGLN